MLSINYELKKDGHFYSGKRHNSLVINGNTGAWHWNSKDAHGNLPVELLKLIHIYDFGYSEKDAYIQAVKRLAGDDVQDTQSRAAAVFGDYLSKRLPPKSGSNTLVLPQKNADNNRAIAYLCSGRGIDYGIVGALLAQGKIYETKQHHNVCFVSSDKDGSPRHAFLRGTLSSPAKRFTKDVPNSDKSYPFLLPGRPESTRVYTFESSVDALSHATLYKIHNADISDGHRISLHGTSFAGLERFLSENPQIREIVSCLDADETGERRAAKLCEAYAGKGYKTFRQAPQGKDYNAQLLNYLCLW